MKTRVLVLVFMVVLAAVTAGCGSRSPYVGTYGSHYNYQGIKDSFMTLQSNGTGSANGYVFRTGATFTWHEDGDHVVIENWQGEGLKFDYGVLTPSGGLHVTGPGGFMAFDRDK